MDSSWWENKEFGSLLITDCTTAIKKNTYGKMENAKDSQPF
jgi:hypothetical protein